MGKSGGATFELKLDDKEVQKRLSGMLARKKNMTPVMKVAGEVLRSSIVRNFEVGGRYSAAGSIIGGSRKWQPLSAIWIALKKRNKTKILIYRGKLMDSIAPRAGRDSVQIGTNRDYGGIHQFGGRSAFGGGRTAYIPARPYLVVQPADMDEISQAINRHIIGG